MPGRRSGMAPSSTRPATMLRSRRSRSRTRGCGSSPTRKGQSGRARSPLDRARPGWRRMCSRDPRGLDRSDPRAHPRDGVPGVRSASCELRGPRDQGGAAGDRPQGAVPELVKTAKPDVVLLDVTCEGFKPNGFDVCRTLKGDVDTRDVPVVMLSAHDKAADQAEGRAVGASDYLLKPFGPIELIKAI